MLCFWNRQIIPTNYIIIICCGKVYGIGRIVSFPIFFISIDREWCEGRRWRWYDCEVCVGECRWCIVSIGMGGEYDILFDSIEWSSFLETKVGYKLWQKTGGLSWTHTHETNESIYFSYFPPYSYQRHLDLIAKATPYVNCFEIFSLFFYIFSL